MKKISTLLTAIAIIAAIATACGTSSKSETADSPSAVGTAATTGGPGPAAAAGATITIENMSFGAPLTVAAGTQIRIVNNDSVEHSVTSQTAGAFDVDVDGKQTGTLVAPQQPGVYPFHCTYHPSMKGTLTVK